MVARRDTREKSAIPSPRGLPATFRTPFETCRRRCWSGPSTSAPHNTHAVTTMEDLAAGLENNPGFFWVNWCGSERAKTPFMTLKASIRAIPLEERWRANRSMHQLRPAGRITRFSCEVLLDNGSSSEEVPDMGRDSLRPGHAQC